MPNDSRGAAGGTQGPGEGRGHTLEMKTPAFQFYPADYLADMRVRMLSFAARGLYVDLLCYCWREGWIPADSSAIAQLSGCHDPAIVEACIALFEPGKEPGKLIHKRLEDERAKQEKHRLERKEAGAKGAKKRWHQRGDSSANGSAIEEPLAKNGSSSSSSSSDIPPNPQGGSSAGLKNLPTTETAKRISDIFHRRHTTPWTDKEVRAYRALGSIDGEELAAVEAYYAGNWPPEREKNNLRHDLGTFLNNFRGEVDRARTWLKRGLATSAPPAEKADHPQWREFLASLGRPYQRQEFAMEHLREKFADWRKQRP